MKKAFGLILMIILSAIMTLPAFLLPKTNANAEIVPFNENSLLNKRTIIDSNYSSFSSEMRTIATQNQNPYDIAGDKMMTGSSLTPAQDEDGNVNLNLSVSGFTISEEDSIYFWLFVPSEDVRRLTVSLVGDGSNKITWSYSGSTFKSMILNAEGGDETYIFGWKLVQLNTVNAQKSITGELSSVVFNKFQLSWNNAGETEFREGVNKLSIYHVYVAKSFLVTSAVVGIQKYVYFKFTEEFEKNFAQFYVKDKFSIDSAEGLFEKLYVAKFDLKNNAQPNYSWDIKLSFNQEKPFAVEFGKQYTCEKTGWLNILIKLNERVLNSFIVRNVTRLQWSKDIPIDEFGIGSFSNNQFKIKNGESQMILFKVSNDFQFDEPIKIETSADGVLTEVSNNGKNYYITVHGVKTGTVQLSISAKGHKFGSSTSQIYSESTFIVVESSGNLNFHMVLLIIIASVYLLGFLVYAIIGIVRHQKNKGVR
ncbi:MAG: hypothetical protein IJ538_00175 [Clostridia bacterium]|nr:hypothetical protein [Clostridia bacterium]